MSLTPWQNTIFTIILIQVGTNLWMYIALIKQFRTTRYIFRKIVVGVQIGKVLYSTAQKYSDTWLFLIYSIYML